MERSFECDLCSAKFISQSRFNHHMTRQHGKHVSTPKKSFTCSGCDKVFGSKQALVYHMRTHTGERPFKCTEDDCEMAFKDPSTLKNHIKSKHSDERPFKCNFPGCTHTAKTSKNLTRHKKMHSDDKPFACSECDYKTNQKTNLKTHRMRHHSTRRDFKCSHPECTKSFKTSVGLKSHFSNRHKERNVHCDHPGCARNFATAKLLNEHKMNCHSKKTFACPKVHCSYRTITRWKVVRHMIVHEGKNEDTLCSIDGCQFKGKNSRVLENHMRLHATGLPCPESGCDHFAPTEEALKNHLKLHKSSGRQFQCPLCSKYYTTLRKLQDHCFAHTNEKSFACGHCGYAASFPSSVKTHISSVHANFKFPFIIHLLDERECIDCKVTVPSADLVPHCVGHLDQLYWKPDWITGFE